MRNAHQCLLLFWFSYVHYFVLMHILMEIWWAGMWISYLGLVWRDNGSVHLEIHVGDLSMVFFLFGRTGNAFINLFIAAGILEDVSMYMATRCLPPMLLEKFKELTINDPLFG